METFYQQENDQKSDIQAALAKEEETE